MSFVDMKIALKRTVENVQMRDYKQAISHFSSFSMNLKSYVVINNRGSRDVYGPITKNIANGIERRRSPSIILDRVSRLIEVMDSDGIYIGQDTDNTQTFYNMINTADELISKASSATKTDDINPMFYLNSVNDILTKLEKKILDIGYEDTNFESEEEFRDIRVTVLDDISQLKAKSSAVGIGDIHSYASDWNQTKIGVMRLFNSLKEDSDIEGKGQIETGEEPTPTEEIEEPTEGESEVPEVTEDELWEAENWDEIVNTQMDSAGQFVGIIIGARGFGKSVLGGWLLDNIASRYDLKPYVVGVPEDKQHLYPNNIGFISMEAIKADIENLPQDAIFLYEEIQKQASARMGGRDFGQRVSDVISTSRHGNRSFIFVAQESRKIDVNIASSTAVVMVKKPQLTQEDTERDSFKEFVESAEENFDELEGGVNQYKKHVYVESILGGQFMKNGIADWWTEEISHVFDEA